MTELAGTVLDWQRQVLAAHRASLDAMGRGVEAAGNLVRLQEAGQQALEANLKAWQSWAGLWGWK